jgi:hypothetical protein
MKRLALLFLSLSACSTKSTAPPAPAPTSSAPVVASSAPAPAPATSCASDSDCSKLSSYCGDLPCACIPYLTSGGAPKCNQPNAVKCLVDPCQRKTAACQDGKCVITAAGATQ